MIDIKVKVAPQEGDRIKWVDTAKALGLFLVFWGHLLFDGSSTAEVINRGIYSFHMPMYFILSGYVIKNDISSLSAFVKNKYKRVFLPVLILYFLTLPLYFLNLNYSIASFKSVMFDVFYVKGNCAYNDPIWFFFCLFQVFLIAKIIRLNESSDIKLIVVLIASLLASFFCNVTQSRVFALFGLNKCMLSFFFLSFGVLLKRIPFEKNMKIVGLISFPVWMFLGVWLQPKVSMYSMVLGYFWFFIIGAITGSLFFFVLCKLLEKYLFVR